MKTKTLLTIALMLALPLTAMAENISGDMYVAPLNADETHPAPTTDADVSYYMYLGRINIDTTDREHLASTAYVKGAYNSAIAAVNAVVDTKQDRIFAPSGVDINGVYGKNVAEAALLDADAGNITQQDWSSLDSFLTTTAGVVAGIKSQRAVVYTTWDNDNATKQVAFVTASGN